MMENRIASKDERIATKEAQMIEGGNDSLADCCLFEGIQKTGVLGCKGSKLKARFFLPMMQK
jgi:hypothetical protein